MMTATTLDHAVVRPPARLAAGLLGLLMAISSLVFIEPAPYDLVAMLMLVTLLVTGLRIPRETHTAVVFLGIFLLGNLLAATLATAPLESIRSLSIRIYMVLAWLLLVSLVASEPRRMLDALWAGYLVAAVLAAAWGTLEYLGVLHSDLWQGGLRAKGPFKDPNVFGPFLVPAAVHCLRRIAQGGPRSLSLYGPLFLALSFGVLLSFSRGAWLNYVLAVGLFGLLTFVTAPRLGEKIKWVLASLTAIGLLVAMLSAAVSVSAIGDRFMQRAVLAQAYDTKVGGRFDSQRRAVLHIATDPVGVGPGRSDEEFGLEPHNLFLHVPVEGGWLAALGFFSFVLLTVRRLLALLRRPGPWRSEVFVIFACLTGTLVQSLFIDSTHWRHLWLLFALAWALIVTCHRSQLQLPRGAVMYKLPTARSINRYAASRTEQAAYQASTPGAQRR